jgi:hypothetical protein
LTEIDLGNSSRHRPRFLKQFDCRLQTLWLLLRLRACLSLEGVPRGLRVVFSTDPPKVPTILNGFFKAQSLFALNEPQDISAFTCPEVIPKPFLGPVDMDGQLSGSPVSETAVGAAMNVVFSQKTLGKRLGSPPALSQNTFGREESILLRGFSESSRMGPYAGRKVWVHQADDVRHKGMILKGAGSLLTTCQSFLKGLIFYPPFLLPKNPHLPGRLQIVFDDPKQRIWTEAWQLLGFAEFSKGNVKSQAGFLKTFLLTETSERSILKDL